MKKDLFAKTVEQALENLPREFKDAMGTVQVVIQKKPSMEQLGRAGLPCGETLYGLFDGISLPEKALVGEGFFPDRVILYQGPLEKDFPDPEDLKREIRITLLHELGHYFGMTEEDLRKRGYD